MVKRQASGIFKSALNGTVHLCEILLQKRENCKELQSVKSGTWDETFK